MEQLKRGEMLQETVKEQLVTEIKEQLVEELNTKPGQKRMAVLDNGLEVWAPADDSDSSEPPGAGQTP